MDIKETVDYVAELARLKFSDSEKENFSQQFGNILEYITAIEKLNLDGVEPLSHIVETENVFRPDMPHESLSVEEALKNAPKRNESFIKVPKVMG